MTVLFIAGWGRSGSTLVERLVGSEPGHFAAGELRYLWERGVIGGGRCGCGEGLSNCPEWTGILRAVAGEESLRMMAGRVLQDQQKHYRTRHVLRRLVEVRTEASSGYVEALRKVYTATREVTGTELLIDSSKFPSDLVAAVRTGIPVKILHLVRDPRACAFSWSATKSEFDFEIPPQGVGRSTANWITWNVFFSAYGHMTRVQYARLTYEDFVASPRDSLAAIMGALEIPYTGAAFIDNHTAELALHHTVSGNTSRFQTGLVQIRSDERWRGGLGKLPRFIATAMTLPVLPHYGYRVTGSSQPILSRGGDS